MDPDKDFAVFVCPQPGCGKKTPSQGFEKVRPPLEEETNQGRCNLTDEIGEFACQGCGTRFGMVIQKKDGKIVGLGSLFRL